MKALVVYKKSTYSFYVEDNQGIDLSKADIKELKKSHDANHLSIKAVTDALALLNVDFETTYRAESFSHVKNDFNLVIAVGGDGTFLEASRIVGGDMIILGINSDPRKSHGHYCVADRGNALEAIRAVVEDDGADATIDARFRIVLSLNGVNYDFPAMNDVLITHACPAGLTRFVISTGLDGDGNEGVKDEEVFCSGMWVSSMSGSTGAIESFDGPQMDERNAEEIAHQIFGMNKNKSNKLHVVNGIQNHIKVISKMREGKIYVDGQHVEIDFPYNCELNLTAGWAIDVVTKF